MIPETLGEVLAGHSPQQAHGLRHHFPPPSQNASDIGHTGVNPIISIAKLVIHLLVQAILYPEDRSLLCTWSTRVHRDQPHFTNNRRTKPH